MTRRWPGGTGALRQTRLLAPRLDVGTQCRVLHDAARASVGEPAFDHAGKRQLPQQFVVRAIFGLRVEYLAQLVLGSRMLWP